jgi:hypothetical protein
MACGARTALAFRRRVINRKAGLPGPRVRDRRAGSLKRPPKTPDRVYPAVKNQEYDRVYDWEYRPG